jgi:hypothetical protein
MRERKNKMLPSQLDKFRVRSIADVVMVSVEVSPHRPGSPRPVVRGLTCAEARELARRLNDAADAAAAVARQAAERKL